MSFKNAYIRLTLFYVLIIMIISISFSVVLFKISELELNRGLEKQNVLLQSLPGLKIIQNPSESSEQIRITQLQESSDRIRLNLIYFNFLILILSTMASYFFAKKTLLPIEEAMEVKDAFTADASHELRTPLTVLRTEIEVGLRDKNLDLKEAKKLLSSNLEEIERLQSLSSALLEITKLDREQDFEFKKISLKPILVDSIEKVKKLSEKKSIKIVSKLQNFNIKGDEDSLMQLFLIIFDNAIKYSHEKSKVNITMRKSKKNIIIEIQDHGIGIAPEELSHIFDRFFRADSSRSKGKVSGFGLGLSIAQRIVKIHKGTIKAESKLGKGSKFIIKFPI